MTSNPETQGDAQASDRSPLDPDWRERTAALFESQGFMRHLGVELEILAPGRVRLSVARSEALTQQGGFFHGGLMSALVDTCGGIASHSLRAPGEDILTVEFKINILRPGAGERLVAEADVTRSGRTLSVARMDVFVERDGQRLLCAVGQGTFIGVPR